MAYATVLFSGRCRQLVFFADTLSRGVPTATAAADPAAPAERHPGGCSTPSEDPRAAEWQRERHLPAVLPPVLRWNTPRKQLPLVATVQQSPGLGPQRIDQVIQIDAPGPRAVAAAAVDPRQLTHAPEA